MTQTELDDIRRRLANPDPMLVGLDEVGILVSEVERLRALLRECIPHIDPSYPIRASGDDLHAMIQAKPFLLDRVRKELGE